MNNDFFDPFEMDDEIREAIEYDSIHRAQDEDIRISNLLDILPELGVLSKSFIMIGKNHWH